MASNTLVVKLPDIRLPEKGNYLNVKRSMQKISQKNLVKAISSDEPVLRGNEAEECRGSVAGPCLPLSAPVLPLSTQIPPNSSPTAFNLPSDTKYEPISNGNGLVAIVYEQYREQFPIHNGSMLAANIDDIYCLSFVMPGCRLRLSLLPPATKRERELAGENIYVHEQPSGTYFGLHDGYIYYLYVEQDEGRLRRDQEDARVKLGSSQDSKLSNLLKDDGRVLESCSCIYGDPCSDEFGCRNWSKRFAVATANGWKGL